eukprot:2227184-Prymnesium_polylepis.1
MDRIVGPSRTLLFPRLPKQEALAAADEAQSPQLQAAAATDEAQPPLLRAAAQCEPAKPQSSGEQPTGVTLVTQASAERLWMLPHICARWGAAPMIAVTLASARARPEWPRFDGAAADCALTRLEVSLAGAGLDAPEAYPINWLRNQGI